MASSAQPTRLSKLYFPRYTTSLATAPRNHQSLALHILHAAQGTHVSDHQRPPARIISSQTWRTLAALPLATTSPLIFSPACTSIAAHRVRSPLRSGPHVVFELPVYPMTLLSSQGVVTQMLSSVLPAMLTARDRCDYQHALEQP